MQTYSLDVGGKNVCFKLVGEGPPIMLFHASPMSSNSLIGLIDELSDSYTVIAPDTPGYGLSEKPDQQPEDISYYSNFFNQFIGELGLKKVALYGTATGAQIAIRMAIDFENHVENLFLDNAAHFSDALRDSIMKSYFPDFTPDESGAHLKKIWNTVDNLFRYFPWNEQTENNKLKTLVPPVMVLDKVMLDYLISGAEYDWAYKAAFKHEKLAHVEALAVPAIIFRWENSIVKKYTDRLFQDVLPSNINEKEVTKEDDRYHCISETIKEHYQVPSSDVNLTNCESVDIDKKNIQSWPDFPPSTMDGSHWEKAWKILDTLIIGNNKKMNDSKNDQLIYWAQHKFSQKKLII